MKYFLLLLLPLFFHAHISAQIVINLQLPPAGIVLKEQLWNLSLVNPSEANTMVQLEMQLNDAATNQPVLTAVSREFMLPKGVKQIRQADILPVTYNVENAAYPVDANPNGFLPVGVFNICFTVSKLNVHDFESVGDECQTIEIEPVSPPSLVLPADLDEVETTRPVFTWIPPAPANFFTRLTYDLTLVEVMPMQSPADAITQNIPVLVSPDVSFTTLQYPATLNGLDTAKTYAWRIKAKNNGMVVANSDTWTFKIAKEKEDNAVGTDRSYYTRLRRQQDGSLELCDGVLHYQYDNELNDTTVSVRIYDITKAKRILVPMESNTATVMYGKNFLQLPLKDNHAVINKHIYLFELTNAKEEQWFLKFEFNTSK